MRTVTATRYVTPLREGGSMPALVEADDEGLYVVKLRGAGQGPKALAAEIIAGELARALELPVPELVYVDLDPHLPDAEPDPEIQELLAGSAGLNVGMDFLPGSLPYTPAGEMQIDPDLAARIVWLDALTENVDRTARNVNLLIWHREPWLIDHGAALYRQHAGFSSGTPQGEFAGDRRSRIAAGRELDRHRRLGAGAEGRPRPARSRHRDGPGRLAAGSIDFAVRR